MTCQPWTILTRWTVAGIPVVYTGCDRESLRTAGIGVAALLDVLPLPVLADATLVITFNGLHLAGSGLVLFADPPTRFLWREPDAWVVYHEMNATRPVRHYAMLDAALDALCQSHDLAIPDPAPRRLPLHSA